MIIEVQFSIRITLGLWLTFDYGRAAIAGRSGFGPSIYPTTNGSLSKFWAVELSHHGNR